MEEAYTQLYQEFLRLRSLCLRQAALLHQLTAALQKQQGAAALPNGDLGDMMSIPVQCTHGIPAHVHENPRARAAAAAAAHDAAARCGFNELSKNMGAVSDLLVEDMSVLCVDSPLHREEEGVKLEQKVAPLLTLDPLDSSPGRADHLGRDRTRMLASDRPSLVADFMSLSGGMLMSDVVLQSHICDFCQAVFPRDSTTKGEFLRHLHTHVP